MVPSYIKLYKNGTLKKRIVEAISFLDKCKVCPNECGTNRKVDKNGLCSSGYFPIVSTYSPHFGEEPVLSGLFGAGNIFFGNCNLKCIYCQNYQISQNPKSESEKEITFERLAEIMIELQERGCSNIGLVSPSHFVPQILIALEIAIEKGLNLPLVYNSNGYDSVQSLRLLDGIVDIYLPDFKYGCSETAKEYSSVKKYFEVASNSLTEMYRQIGDEYLIEDEVLRRGIIVRHLVLPNDLADTEMVLKFISTLLSSKLHISLMSQYHPVHKAKEKILLSRKLNENEYDRAVRLLEKYDLNNGWIQELESHNYYLPDFENDRENPFNNCNL